MIITDTNARAFDTVSIDLHGPLDPTESGNKWILTMLDLLTKYFIVAPLKQASATEVARALVDHLICQFGPPKAILTDQGTVFQGKVIEALARIFKVGKFRTSAFHPQSSGALERTHDPLVQYIKQFCGLEGQWDKYLPLAMFAHNSAKHASSGYSPFELVRGYKVRIPHHFPPRDELMTYDEYLAELTDKLQELQTLAALNLIQAKYKSKFYYDRKINPVHFREGERVYLVNDSNEHKHKKDSYVGPFEITKIDAERHNAEIQTGNYRKVVHLDKLKRAFEAVTLENEILKPTQEILDQMSMETQDSV